MDWRIGNFVWRETGGSIGWNGPEGTICAFDFANDEQRATDSAKGDRRIGIFGVRDDARPNPSDWYQLGEGHPAEIVPTVAQRRIIAQNLSVGTPGATLADVFATIWKQGDPTGQNQHRPITATHKLNLDVRCGGGLGLISSQPFKWGEPGYARVIETERKFLLQYKGHPQAGKILGAVVRKYCGRFDDPRFRDFLTPNEFDLEPERPATSLYENFTTPTYSWTAEDAGAWTFNTGAAACLTPAANDYGARCNTSLSGSDHYCQCTITQWSTAANHQIGPAVAMTNANYANYDLTVYGPDDPDGWYLREYTGSGGSALDTYAGNVSTPWLMTLIRDGSTLSGLDGAYGVGTERLSGTDSTYSGTYCGLHGVSTVSTVKADEWYAADLAADAARNIIIGGGIF